MRYKYSYGGRTSDPRVGAHDGSIKPLTVCDDETKAPSKYHAHSTLLSIHT